MSCRVVGDALCSCRLPFDQWMCKLLKPPTDNLNLILGTYDCYIRKGMALELQLDTQTVPVANGQR
jgi:hypothetical protein